MWYHVENSYVGKKVEIDPYIPRINATQKEFEGNIPRICVSSSIFLCLRAKFGYNRISSIFFEDLCENPCVYFTESVPYIPPSCSDFRSNDERWFLSSTKFRFLGRVDVYKLLTREILEPTTSVQIRLPKNLTTIYTAKENFLGKILDKQK